MMKLWTVSVKKLLTGHARRATRVKVYKDNEVEGMKTAGDLDKDEA
jgi:hypothetical protein